MFDAPEAARRDGAFLRVGREIDAACAAVVVVGDGVEAQAGGRGEGAEEAGEEVWHHRCGGGHYEEEEEGGEEEEEEGGCSWGLQV